MNLLPRSWPDAFSFFRKKPQKQLEVSREESHIELVSVADITIEPNTLPLRHESDSSMEVPESGLDVTVVDTALIPVNSSLDKTDLELSKPAIRIKATLAPRKPALKLASRSIGVSMPSLDQVIAKIREIFDEYRTSFPSPPGFPDPLLSFVSVTERSVGIGSRIGNEPIGAFGTMALKGVRLEVVLRFLLWANSMGDVDESIQNLIGTLLADRDDLRAQGVLRLGLNSVGVSESSSNQWRQSADFNVLYEEPFIDNDGAESLIAQIPINLDDELNEKMVITDEMVRWDDEDENSAPPLVARGPLKIANLSALYHFEIGNEPTGTVTLRRTFDAASGQPSNHADFDAFLAAITDHVNPDPYAEFVFNSPNDFLAEFTEQGDTIELGQDITITPYRLLILNIDPPINLPLATDRFEIIYQHTKFDQPAVLYLRAAHPITT